jgi:hypothetical protein
MTARAGMAALFAASIGLTLSSPADAQVRQRDHRGPGAAPAISVRGMSPDSGTPGTEVTIRGNFPGDAEVLFNRRQAEVTRRTPRSLTFVVPTGRAGGTFPIIVRAGGVDVEAGKFRMEGAVAVPPPPPPPPPDLRPEPRPRPDRRNKPIVTDYSPRIGPAGTIVTVQGRHFGKDLELVYGNSVLPMKRMSNRSFQFEVPRREGDNLIILRVPRGRDVVVGGFNVVKQRHPDDRRKIWKERQSRAEKRWKERQRELARSQAEREAELRRQEEEMRREREARRRAQQAALRAKWEAAFLATIDVRAEMAIHAERMARLQRMLRLAEAGDHGGLAVRIHVLMDAEGARHEQRMNDLRTAHARR